jgi:hypothetical protein
MPFGGAGLGERASGRGRLKLAGTTEGHPLQHMFPHTRSDATPPRESCIDCLQSIKRECDRLGKEVIPYSKLLLAVAIN